MRELYRHTQVGYRTMLVFLVVGSAFTLYVAQALWSWRQAGGVRSVFAEGFLLLSLFMTFLNVAGAVLTVKVTTENIEVRFPFAILKTRVPIGKISDLRRAEAVWVTGFGYRFDLFGNVTWHVEGSEGVKLELACGKYLTIGTNDPEGLENAIRQALEDKRLRELPS